MTTDVINATKRVMRVFRVPMEGWYIVISLNDSEYKRVGPLKAKPTVKRLERLQWAECGGYRCIVIEE